MLDSVGERGRDRVVETCREDGDRGQKAIRLHRLDDHQPGFADSHHRRGRPAATNKRNLAEYLAGSQVGDPALIGGFSGLSPEKPMPSVADIADPVVSALIEPGSQRGLRARLERETGIRVIETPDADYAVVSRTITRYGDVPWLVAVYFPAADLANELWRLAWAAIAGVAVLIVSLIAAFDFARYLSAPINRLAPALSSD